MRVRRVVARVTAVLAFLVPICLVSATASAATPTGTNATVQRTYVGLGDSYSSGKGNPRFEAGTNGPSDFCHRSKAAYANLVATTFGLHLDFIACSGSSADNITTKPYDHEPLS